MKSCPTCHRTYDDEQLRFCLEDGTPLTGAQDSVHDPGATIKIPPARLTSDAPTEVLGEGQLAPTQRAQPEYSTTARPVSPRRDDLLTESMPAGRKSSAAPWILGAAVVLGLSAIAVAVIMTRNNMENSQTAQANQTTNTSSSANTIPASGRSNEAMDNVGVNRSVTPAQTPASVNQSTTPSSKTPEQPTPTPNRTPTPRPTQQTTPTPEATPTPRPRPSGPISGGVLNGRAISKPQPAYPAIARAARASGTVTVQVLVDESGRVTQARAVSGHPLLQPSAVQAAYQARFAPTLLSGQPVKVTGVITYNFVAQ